MPRKKKDYSPLPGFPLETQFQCMEEIDEYLSHNSIQCRECGHSFSALARHITKQHEITADEYKERHGIPWSRGLVSGHFHSKLSQYAKEIGVVAHIGAESGMIKGKKINARAYCPARVNARRVYPRELYFEIADRVLHGEALLTICREERMPHISAVVRFREKDREFGAYWKRMVAPEVLPWRTSVRKNLKSGRVEKAIEMADGGHSAKKISKETGYGEANARLFLKRKNWDRVRKAVNSHA